MFTTPAYAALAPGAQLVPWTLERRAPGPRDVIIEILYCGVCHSDYHYISGEWGSVPYPAVPGHEIVGRVVEAGPQAGRFRPGDLVGVGCLVDSCRHCAACAEGVEQYCVEQWAHATYGGTEKQTGRPTYGGYSGRIVVDEHFVLRLPPGLDPAGAAPLLCAGITTWSPLRHWNVGPGSEVGVVGLGGLGHMAIKLANAMGAEVVLFTTSPGKAEDARRLGAHRIVLSTDPAAMAAMAKRLDLTIDTVSWSHDLDPYLAALKRDGTHVLLGLPPTPHPPTTAAGFVNGRVNLSGSLIGGIRETQEMLDFCGEHGIVSDIETIRMDEIDRAFARMLKGDVKYRFVIDMATLPPL
jgi:uncharacterized zinc-type alcohol dehydrogenase-like protein